MTELFTRLRFAVACLQGRPVARHLNCPGGIITKFEAKSLIADVEGGHHRRSLPEDWSLNKASQVRRDATESV